MDVIFEHKGTTFIWNDNKALENESKHGVEFTEAATVFDDPLLVMASASRNGEERDKAIGFSAAAKLLAVVHIEAKESIRIIPAWPASTVEEALYDQ
jgi:uncharacterized DUF497 family protein